MNINWGGRQKPEPKEIINDEELGTIKVFKKGLDLEDKFFRNYEGLEFKYVTEDNVQVPVRIGKTEGFDVDHEEFAENREEYLTCIRRIRSYEKTIMDEILPRAENDIAEALSTESEEFRNSLVSITISVSADITEAVSSPDDVKIISDVEILSGDEGAHYIEVDYFLDLNKGTMEECYSDESRG